MEDKESTTGHYDSLIWLLMTDYDGQEYCPSDYVIDSLKPAIDKARGDIILEIHDSTVYDFTIAKGFSNYWEHFNTMSSKFSNSLVILSYLNEKNIVRDCYLASVTKLYTCWDIVYLNCDVPEKISSKSFDFILTPKELPDKLTEVIKNGKS